MLGISKKNRDMFLDLVKSQNFNLHYVLFTSNQNRGKICVGVRSQRIFLLPKMFWISQLIESSIFF